MKERFSAKWAWFCAFLLSLVGGVWAGIEGKNSLDAAASGDVKGALAKDIGSSSGCGCSGCTVMLTQLGSTMVGYLFLGLSGVLVVFALFALVRFVTAIKKQP